MQEDGIEEFFKSFEEKPRSYALVSYINNENEIKAAVLDMLDVKDFNTLTSFDLDFMKMMLWMQKSEKMKSLLSITPLGEHLTGAFDDWKN